MTHSMDSGQKRVLTPRIFILFLTRSIMGVSCSYIAHQKLWHLKEGCREELEWMILLFRELGGVSFDISVHSLQNSKVLHGIYFWKGRGWITGATHLCCHRLSSCGAWGGDIFLKDFFRFFHKSSKLNAWLSRERSLFCVIEGCLQNSPFWTCSFPA